MDYLEIGQIINTHGIKGEVKIRPFTDNINQYKDFKTLKIKLHNEILEFEVQSVKFFKDNIIIKLKTIDSIDDANKYRNAIVLKEKNYDELPEGRYYIVDLIGLDVIDENNNKIGYLYDIFNTGSNDIYHVKTDFGKNIYLPAIEECILDINLDEKKIIVHLMEGLDD